MLQALSPAKFLVNGRDIHVDPGGKVFDYGDQDLEIAGRMGDYVGAAAARFIAPGPDEDSSNEDGGNA